MKTKYVGRISMGISLIGLGILLLLSQFTEINILDIGMKLWPMVLIILGLELIWTNYRANKEEVNLKVDFFSIIVIIGILFINLVIFGMLQFDIIDKLDENYTYSRYIIGEKEENIEVSENIEKIVIDNLVFADKVTIRETKDNNISATYDLQINGMTDDNTRKELEDMKFITSSQKDNTLYLKLNQNSHKNYYKNIYIFIPEGKDVEVRDVDDLELDIEDGNNNYSILDSDTVRVNIRKDSDMRIKGSLYEEENFRGNILWNIIEDKNSDYIGEYIYGNGQNRLNILGADTIIVNEK